MSNKKSKSKNSGMNVPPKIKYIFWNTVVFTSMFLLIFKIWLEEMDNEWLWYYIIPYNLKFLWIFAVNFLLGIVVSLFVRISTGYSEYAIKPINDVLRNFFQSMLYSGIIWIGVIQYFFETFSLGWVIIILFGTKIIIFLLAEMLADKVSFGR